MTCWRRVRRGLSFVAAARAEEIGARQRPADAAAGGGSWRGLDRKGGKSNTSRAQDAVGGAGGAKDTYTHARAHTHTHTHTWELGGGGQRHVHTCTDVR